MALTFIEVTKRMPLMSLPVRTTVVQLADARLLLSPASTLTPEQLASAGAVTDIVAPSLLHVEGMKAAAAAHPEARLWGPAGVKDKLPELAWHGLLGVTPWPHEEALELVPLEGVPRMNESVFLHRASRTLLVTDLVFNILDAKGLGARFVLTVFGTHRRFGVSRLFLRFVKDRPAFEASLRRVAALEFDRLVPAHGQTVNAGAKERLLSALRERGLNVSGRSSV